MKEWFLAFILGQKSLARLIPDYEALLSQPARTLAGHPVHIGPLRLYRLAGFFFLLTPVLPFYFNVDQWLFEGPLLATILVWSIGPLLGLLSLLPVGNEIFLSATGVRIKLRRSEVWCPWDLFRVPGTAWLERSWSLVLPIASEAIDQVEFRRQGQCVARGREIRTMLLHFKSDREASVAARFKAPARELGQLLLRLGQALGRRPRPPETIKVLQTSEVFRPAQLSGGEVLAPESWVECEDGWFRLALSHFSWPRVCCDCQRKTNQHLDVEVARGDLPGRLVHVMIEENSVLVPVPVCGRCQSYYRFKHWLGRLAGVAVGLLIVAALVLQIVFRDRIQLLSFELLVMLVAIGGAIFPVLGFVIGSHWRGRPPIEVGIYLPREAAVTMRFLRPAFQDRIRSVGGDGT